MTNKILKKEDLNNLSFEDSLKELEKDHEFLLKGDVFTQDVIDRWIEYKMENEVKTINKMRHQTIDK